MGHEEPETASVPSAAALAEHITSNWTSDGVYPRGIGDGFLSIVLPNRFDMFTAFLDDVRQLAGRGSRIVYVSNSDETRLDVYLGSKFEDGANPMVKSGPSMCRIIMLGAASGLISAFGILALSGMDRAMREE